MTIATAQSPVGFSLSALIEGWVEKARTARIKHAAYQAAYNNLQQMTDQELVEFGLFRSDLAEMARKQVGLV